MPRDNVPAFFRNLLTSAGRSKRRYQEAGWHFVQHVEDHLELDDARTFRRLVGRKMTPDAILHLMFFLVKHCEPSLKLVPKRFHDDLWAGILKAIEEGRV